MLTGLLTGAFLVLGIIALQTLRRRFDAVFLGTGAGISGDLRIEGDLLPGVYPATEFLVRANLEPALLPNDLRMPVAAGSHVVVIGGGDTAMDCVRTARRLGAAAVTCVYRRGEAEMPGRVEERKNAREEGVEFRFLTAPVRFLADGNGRLRALVCQQMELGDPDASGRRRPVPVPGAQFEIACDTAVAAIGFNADPIWKSVPGLVTDRWGLIVVDPETGESSLPGVFAGGDNVNGADLVVTALAAGRRAARGIDGFLARTGYPESLAAD